FRMMDPASHRMIGVRADMTPQIARVAATRLGDAPRPLRLSYAGQVLRVTGSEIRPERQIGQVGAELIGAAGPAADVEAIAVAGASPGRTGPARHRDGPPLRGCPGTQGDCRPGREPRLRVPHRDQLYAFRRHTEPGR